MISREQFEVALKEQEMKLSHDNQMAKLQLEEAKNSLALFQKQKARNEESFFNQKQVLI